MSWLPAVLTPGRLMFPVLSKTTPPIVLDPSNAVAAPINFVDVKAPVEGL